MKTSYFCLHRDDANVESASFSLTGVTGIFPRDVTAFRDNERSGRERADTYTPEGV